MLIREIRGSKKSFRISNGMFLPVVLPQSYRKAFTNKAFSGIICDTTMILNSMTTKASKPEHIPHKNPQKSCAFHIKNMQNKANLNKSECPLTSFMSMSYVKSTTFYVKKTNPIQSQYKPNTKPIQTQFRPNKPNSNPNKPKSSPENHRFCFFSKTFDSPNSAGIITRFRKFGFFSESVCI